MADFENRVVGDGDELIVSVGMIAANTTVNLGGTMRVEGGGEASSTVVNSGGVMHVSGLALLSGETVIDGGVMHISGHDYQGTWMFASVNDQLKVSGGGVVHASGAMIDDVAVGAGGTVSMYEGFDGNGCWVYGDIKISDGGVMFTGGHGAILGEVAVEAGGTLELGSQTMLLNEATVASGGVMKTAETGVASASFIDLAGTLDVGEGLSGADISCHVSQSGAANAYFINDISKLQDCTVSVDFKFRREIRENNDYSTNWFYYIDNDSPVGSYVISQSGALKFDGSITVECYLPDGDGKDYFDIFTIGMNESVAAKQYIYTLQASGDSLVLQVEKDMVPPEFIGTPECVVDVNSVIFYYEGTDNAEMVNSWLTLWAPYAEKDGKTYIKEHEIWADVRYNQGEDSYSYVEWALSGLDLYNFSFQLEWEDCAKNSTLSDRIYFSVDTEEKADFNPVAAVQSFGRDGTVSTISWDAALDALIARNPGIYDSTWRSNLHFTLRVYDLGFDPENITTRFFTDYDVAATSFDVSGLASGTYYYRVLAQDERQTEPVYSSGSVPFWSEIKSFTVGGEFEVESEITGGNVVDISWDAPEAIADVARYELLIDGVRTLDMGVDTTAQLRDLNSGTHYFSVGAYDSAGNSVWSARDYVSVGAPSLSGGNTMSGSVDGRNPLELGFTVNNPGIYRLGCSFYDTDSATVKLYSNGKKIATGKVKNGVFTCNKELLLDSSNIYDISIVSKDGDVQDCEIWLDTLREYTKADQRPRDDSYAAAPVLDCVPGNRVANEWVGFGDAVDYRKLNVACNGNYGFKLSLIESSARLTVYEQKNGKLKKLKSLTVSTGSGAIADKLSLRAGGDYYVAVESRLASRGKGTSYTLEVTGTEFDNPGNGIRNNYWESYSCKDTEIGEFVLGAEGGIQNEWVGFGDAVDFFEFTSLEQGSFDFMLDLECAKAAKMTLYRVEVSGSLKRIGSSRSEIKNAKLQAGGSYALEIASADNGKGKYNTGYNVVAIAAGSGI